MKDLTAKEKAKELVEQFIHASGSTCDHDSYCSQPECQWYGRLVCCVDIMKAKKYAIIEIDALIIQNGELYLNGLDGIYYRTKNSYLFEVKSEIEKL